MTTTIYSPHTLAPYSYWVREAEGEWSWIEVQSPEEVWSHVGDGELFVSPIPWPLRMFAGRKAVQMPDDRGPDGLRDVVRLSLSEVTT